MGHYASELDLPTPEEAREINRAVREMREAREGWACRFLLWAVARLGPADTDSVMDLYEELCEKAGMSRRQRRRAFERADYLIRDARWTLDGRRLISWKRLSEGPDLTITAEGRKVAPRECPGLLKD